MFVLSSVQRERAGAMQHLCCAQGRTQGKSQARCSVARQPAQERVRCAGGHTELSGLPGFRGSRAY